MRRTPPILRNPQIDIHPLREVPSYNISRAILAYRPVEGAVHQARIRKAKEILARRGYKVTGSAIGKGTMGTVFALEEYPEYVAKLTYDPTDAALMAEMAQIERKARAAGKPMPAGLPRVVTIATLGTESDPLGLFLVVVERLVPLSAEQKRRVRKIARDTGWGQDADTEAGDELWRYWQRQKKSPEYAFLNAARTVHDLGFVPYDLDAPNMMQRAADGTVVVSDFGYSAPKAKTQARSIQRLKNPRGIAREVWAAERAARRTRKDWPEWARSVLLDPVWDAEDVIDYDPDVEVAHVEERADLDDVLRWTGTVAPRHRRR